MPKISKLSSREGIKFRIRKKVIGTAIRPRLVVFRSLNNIYASLVDDVNGKTIFTVSSLNKEITAAMKDKIQKKDKSKIVGKILAEKAKQNSINKVVFDRNGYLYHGRVKSLAEGAREGGLEF
jgi:large subunit ribosomal protein L18